MASRKNPSRVAACGRRLLLLVLLCAPGGCQLPGLKKPETLPQPAFPETPTKDDVVGHINERAAALSGWRSENATITVPGPVGMPMSLGAHVAVQSPQNFRLVAKSLRGLEADFGSNDEEFWFWMRSSDAEKYVYHASHQDIELVQRRLPIPFRPDWIMGALGVTPLNGRNVELRPVKPDDQVLQLISSEKSPGGHLVYRLIEVDRATGDVVRQSLQDSMGRTIALADFQDYRGIADDASKQTIRLPQRIVFHWPQAKSSMTLTLGTQIEVNPGSMPDWSRPDYDGYRPFDLARSSVDAPGRSGRAPQNDKPEFQPAGHGNEKPLDRPNFSDEAGPSDWTGSADHLNSGSDSDGGSGVRPSGFQSESERPGRVRLSPAPFPFPETGGSRAEPKERPVFGDE